MREVRLGFVGDLAFGKSLQGILKPFSEVKHILNSADILFGNLEFPFSRQKRPASDYSYEGYCVNEGFEKQLFSQVHFDVLNIANNHIMDWGEEGLNLTSRILRDRGVAIVGAGSDEAEARSGVLIERGGLRFGFLGYAKPGFYSCAGNRPGAARLDVDSVYDDVRRIRGVADYVIVSVHAGLELSDYPSPQEVAVNRAIIEAGADVLVGHHAHVLQGFERFKGGYIFYDLGSFVFDPLGEKADARIDISKVTQSAIVFLGFCPTHVDELLIVPCEFDIHARKVKPAQCERKERILAHMHNISAGLADVETEFYRSLPTNDIVNRFMKNQFYRIRTYGVRGLWGVIKDLKLRYVFTITRALLTRLWSRDRCGS